MGKKGRSQTKVIKKTLGSDEDQQDLQRYFNQMVGSEKADPTIVLPKYKELMSLLGNMVSLFQSSEEIIGKLNEYKGGVSEMRQFATKLAELYDSRVPEEKFQSEHYAAVKDHDVVHTLIVACSSFSDIHAHLKKEWADVDKKFFMRYSATKFTPFSFAPNMDFKRLWLVEGNANDQIMEYTFTFMKTCFKKTHAIYKIVTSPDVDVSNLSRIIIEALRNLKQHLPRCNKAFRKIEESASMLENNFDSYYKDFVQTKDPANIFTGFIGDVANTCDSDAQLVFQCRRIVNFYKKNARRQTANGTASSEKTKMFDTLMSKYNIFEKKALSSLDAKEEDDEYESDEEKNSASAPPADESNDTELPDLESLLSQINDPKVKSITLDK
jgi:hypothetical protein